MIQNKSICYQLLSRFQAVMKEFSVTKGHTLENWNTFSQQMENYWGRNQQKPKETGRKKPEEKHPEAEQCTVMYLAE